jgi:hypothetical protein
VWTHPNFVISFQSFSYFFWQRYLSLQLNVAEWLKSQGELIKVPVLASGWQSVARCLGILREVILKSNLQFITDQLQKSHMQVLVEIWSLSLSLSLSHTHTRTHTHTLPDQWKEKHWVLVKVH